VDQIDYDEIVQVVLFSGEPSDSSGEISTSFAHAIRLIAESWPENQAGGFLIVCASSIIASLSQVMTVYARTDFPREPKLVPAALGNLGSARPR
jgi:hypothetical protein